MTPYSRPSPPFPRMHSARPPSPRLWRWGCAPQGGPAGFRPGRRSPQTVQTRVRAFVGRAGRPGRFHPASMPILSHSERVIASLAVLPVPISFMPRDSRLPAPAPAWLSRKTTLPIRFWKHSGAPSLAALARVRNPSESPPGGSEHGGVRVFVRKGSDFQGGDFPVLDVLRGKDGSLRDALGNARNSRTQFPPVDTDTGKAYVHDVLRIA